MLLLFLRSLRATLISAVTIPVTIAITFLFLRWFKQGLNLMSMGGLAIAIGLVIDDTVVVNRATPAFVKTPIPTPLCPVTSGAVRPTRLKASISVGGV